ncbi:hypothetical protein E2N92_07140 [Methanofollis formosanus]|uniref:Transglutaminase-like domain-containing protein n=1 Tax=Methanofollis formosanus TaxID=299308 RepID=A0A8G1A2I1_9EURY|nr:hypothetical protein [Methanofollis formosanus]QYZ79226.1 hypothetical protein E2N92_07140 [Methanofollis formosanus]
MRTIPQWAGIVVIALLCSSVLIVSGVVPFLRPAAVYPSITPVAGNDNLDPAEFVFSFEKEQYHLKMPVDAAVYGGAREGSKNAVLYEDLADEVWMAEYYQAFLEDPHQEDLYVGLLRAFENVRDEKKLDSDRYLEMITAFVQAIPYQVHPPDTPPKFPIETVAERKGDCDDKSLLLAALLSRAGYDVVLFNFVDDGHMAVGVASDSNTFGQTGYAYIETTDRSFVGAVPISLAGGVTLTGEPQVIGIGNGTARYRSSAETAYIIVREQEAKEIVGALNEEIARRSEALRNLEERLHEEKTSITALLETGDTAGYNAEVMPFNRDVKAYNQNLSAYQSDVERYDLIAGVYNYIVEHRHDRPGTYQWLLDHPLPA